jgi:hypothetical protein
VIEPTLFGGQAGADPERHPRWDGERVRPYAATYGSEAAMLEAIRLRDERIEALETALLSDEVDDAIRTLSICERSASSADWEASCRSAAQGLKRLQAAVLAGEQDA